jgi:hypothetical protein
LHLDDKKELEIPIEERNIDEDVSSKSARIGKSDGKNKVL